MIELHANALPDNADEDTLPHKLVTQLRAVYPEFVEARVRHAEHLLAADCPLFAPGSFSTKPTVTTPDPALALAGDLVRVDLPVALMERAATTGFAAANALLSQWHGRGHELWSVTNGGRSPIPRRTARRSATPSIRRLRDRDRGLHAACTTPSLVSNWTRKSWTASISCPARRG